MDAVAAESRLGATNFTSAFRLCFGSGAQRRLAALLMLGIVWLRGEDATRPRVLPRQWPKAELSRYLALKNEWGLPQPATVATKAMIAGTTGPLAVHAGFEALRLVSSPTDYRKELAGEGEFSAAVLDGLRARGQPVEIVPRDNPIVLVAASSPAAMNARAEGY